MKTFTISIAVACLSAILLTVCSGNGDTSTSSAVKVMTHEDTVQRGAFLVKTLGCNDCHSPKRMKASGLEIIPEPMLSGYPADGKLPDQDKNALKKGWLLLPLTSQPLPGHGAFHLPAISLPIRQG
jgi:hypothetical protein